MYDDEGTRVVLCNLIHDVEAGRLDEDSVGKVLGAAMEKWRGRPKKLPASEVSAYAASVLEEALDDLPDDGLCGGPVIPNGKMLLSRVTDSKSIEERLFRKGPRAKISRHGPDAFKPGDMIRFRVVDVKRSAEIRGVRRPMAWVTNTRAVDEIIGTAIKQDQIATDVRNELGLLHYKAGRILVEIQYPDKDDDPEQLHGPTAFDGACVAVYRSCDETDKWGRAVHLLTLEAKRPEAVHRTIPFTHSFRLRFLGVVASPDPDPTYGSLVKKCKCKWSDRAVQKLRALMPTSKRRR
jgi:hypothetical protein